MPKYQMNRMSSNDTLVPLYPETTADIVKVDNTAGHYSGSATNTQNALEELYSIASTGGVTSVNGRSGAVTLSATDVGLSNLTNDKQVIGLSTGTTSGHLVMWGEDGYNIADAGVSIVNSITSNSSDIPTASAVYNAIDNLPEPMIFKGTLGTGGTISSLPTASSSNEGWTYKVITAGTYQSIACDVGDVLTSNGSEWVRIPSGDDTFTDTWRAIYVNGTEVLSNGINTGAVDIRYNSGLTVAYTAGNSAQGILPRLTFGVDSSRIIPFSTAISAWNAKYDKPSTGIPASDLESSVQSALSLAGTALQHNETITLTGDVTGSGSTTIATTLKTVMDGSTIPTTPGNWQVVAVNAKGLVTAGNNLVEYGTSSVSSPTSYLAVDGIFFKYLGD